MAINLCTINGGIRLPGACDCHKFIVPRNKREKRAQQFASWKRETEHVGLMRKAA